MGPSDVIWKPNQEFLEESRIARFMKTHEIESYEDLVQRCSDDTEWFWGTIVEELGVEWDTPYTELLDDSKGFPWAQWFIGGKLNIVRNCIDRHAKGDRSSHPAMIWEGDDGEVRTFSYRELSDLIGKAANALTELGVVKGDAVGIYLPMIPEAAIAFFACLKVGAIVVPIFSGFGAPAVSTRIQDCSAKVMFTADGGFRRGKNVSIKEGADRALSSCDSITHVIVVQRTGDEIPWTDGRDLWWHDVVERQSPDAKTVSLEAEDHSMILYTSGTTGKPKGTVHTHAGALSQIIKELGFAFDVRPDEVFWWFTDIGWMMGPWEMIGVTFFGGTFLLFEGAPNYPTPARVWEIVDRHKVATLGISPTAIRLLKSAGDEWLENADLSSLRILGSTGEPWDPDSYMWFFDRIGGGRCPIINISGGTEIVGCLLSPLPINELKPCTLRGPGLGMAVDVFDEEGNPVRGKLGHLVCKKPAPSMTKGFLGDPDRYINTYFSRWDNVWYHGDWAMVDDDGYWFLYGRSDDTINVAGKRLGPAEVEAALTEHPEVSEAAAFGYPHDIKGEAVGAVIVLKDGSTVSEDLRAALRDKVGEVLGKPMRPDLLKFVTTLPKTRSGKIVRGIIRRKILGEDVGDLASVENPEAVDAIAQAV